MWIFSYPQVLIVVLGALKNRLIEMVLLSTHNICFGWEIRKSFLITHCYLEAWFNTFSNEERSDLRKVTLRIKLSLKRRQCSYVVICWILSKMLFFFQKFLLWLPSVRVSNSVSPDQTQQYVGPDLGKNICKTWMHDHGKNVCKHVCLGYQQTTLASKEFRQNCFLTM